jgi:hypothetical protein
MYSFAFKTVVMRIFIFSYIFFAYESLFYFGWFGSYRNERHGGAGAGAESRIKNPQGTFIILAEPEP